MPAPPKRVLIAEDDPAMLNVMRFNLERAGFEVETAANGLEATRLFDEQTFDLVITDLQMPRMSGEEVCQHIRRQAGPSKVAIVVCTAKGLEIDTARMFVDYELEQVLFKPFSPAEMVSLAKSALDSHPEVSSPS